MQSLNMSHACVLTRRAAELELGLDSHACCGMSMACAWWRRPSSLPELLLAEHMEPAWLAPRERGTTSATTSKLHSMASLVRCWRLPDGLLLLLLRSCCCCCCWRLLVGRELGQKGGEGWSAAVAVLQACTSGAAAKQSDMVPSGMQGCSARPLWGRMYAYEGVSRVVGGHFQKKAPARPSYLSENFVDSLDMRAVIGMLAGALVGEHEKSEEMF